MPDAMATVTTTIDSDNVKITFVAPDDNGDSITGYDIEIRYSDGTTFAESSDCDGSTGLIIGQLYCTVAMATLRDGPTYNLAYADLVVVRARAYNSIGTGDYSQVNTDGATVETEPGTMTDPYRGSSTDTTQIEINWDALTDIGGSAITSYHLETEVIVGSGTWTDLQGQSGSESLLTSFTVIGLTEADERAFRVTAYNIHGAGT